MTASGPSSVLIRPAVEATMWLGGVGVDIKVRSEDTGGAFSVVEHPILPGALVPPHIHRAEDELSYIVEGTIGARIGDEVVEARARRGDYLFKPRGVPHTFWNGTDWPARLIEVIWPGGFERFFEELARAFEDGNGVPDATRVSDLADRYQNTFVMDWVADLETRHAVSVAHGGGR